MRFDTLNFTLVGLGILFLAIAVFRSRDLNATPPAMPKNPIGF